MKHPSSPIPLFLPLLLASACAVGCAVGPGRPTTSSRYAGADQPFTTRDEVRVRRAAETEVQPCAANEPVKVEYAEPSSAQPATRDFTTTAAPARSEEDAPPKVHVDLLSERSEPDSLDIAPRLARLVVAKPMPQREVRDTHPRAHEPFETSDDDDDDDDDASAHVHVAPRELEGDSSQVLPVVVHQQPQQLITASSTAPADARETATATALRAVSCQAISKKEPQVRGEYVAPAGKKPVKARLTAAQPERGSRWSQLLPKALRPQPTTAQHNERRTAPTPAAVTKKRTPSSRVAARQPLLAPPADTTAPPSQPLPEEPAPFAAPGSAEPAVADPQSGREALGREPLGSGNMLQPTEGQPSEAQAEEWMPDFKPIGSLTTSITAPTGSQEPTAANLLPTDYAAKAFEHYQPAQYRSEPYAPWRAYNAPSVTQTFCHRPLYYEEVNVERFGYHYGLFQPFVSATRFYATTLMLPYKMTLQPPGECRVDPSPFPPGVQAPLHRERVPLRLKPALVQAATIVGLIAVLP